MAHFTCNTPIGFLTLFESDGALVAVESGRCPDSGPPTPLLRDAADAVSRYFDGSPESFDFPFIPAATPFQMRVRDAMRAIPYGETRTYADLARDLGSAPRAVGTACARNPLPILVPCHRVVGTDRKLHGFSFPGGIDTKRALLILEGAYSDLLNPEET